MREKSVLVGVSFFDVSIDTEGWYTRREEEESEERAYSCDTILIAFQGR